MTWQAMHRRAGFTALLGGLVALAGCNFDVKNPGAILEADINDPNAVKALVTGMSAEFSEGYDGTAFTIARLTDEMAGSGSYNSTGRLRRGIMDNDDTNGIWGDIHEARALAEEGLERMLKIEGFQIEGNPLTARAYLFAGFSNRWLGELFCEVAYNLSAAQPRIEAFKRAIPQFNEAIRHAQLAQVDTFVTTANAGLAQVYVGLGDWAKAVQHANMVPTSFQYIAFYSANSGVENNEIWNETHGRNEMSAFGALAGRTTSGGLVGFNPPDPRAKFTDCRKGACQGNALGADGLTPHLRQEKYDDVGSDIPIVSGTEMRLIEAEAALRNNDLNGFLAGINAARAFHKLQPILASQVTGIGSIKNTDPNDAWSILDRERYLDLWLEGRRLFDLHRWDHPFLNGGTVIYPENKLYAGISRRTSCMPISFDECSVNPNIPCK